MFCGHERSEKKAQFALSLLSCRRMLVSAVALVTLVLPLAAGCSSSGSFKATGPADGAIDDATDSALDATDPAQDAAQDAVDGQSEVIASDSTQTACDPGAPFGAPILLPGVNTAATEGGPRLTADELTLYFSRGLAGSVSNLFVARRSSATAPFESPLPLTTTDSSFNEYDPTTLTELTIFFTSEDRPEGDDIWVATRPSTVTPFGPPSALAAPLNSGSSDAEPFLRADGTELWFASNRPGGAGGYDIYRAGAAGESFGSPQRVPEISSAADDYTPTLSADGLSIFFSSTRTDGDAQGGPDIWTASRAQATDSLSDLSDVSILNSASADFPGWLSQDGCRLYMSSTRPGGPGGEDIYIATRGM